MKIKLYQKTNFYSFTLSLCPLLRAHLNIMLTKLHIHHFVINKHKSLEYPLIMLYLMHNYIYDLALNRSHYWYCIYILHIINKFRMFLALLNKSDKFFQNNKKKGQNKPLVIQSNLEFCIKFSYVELKSKSRNILISEYSIFLK